MGMITLYYNFFFFYHVVYHVTRNDIRIVRGYGGLVVTLLVKCRKQVQFQMKHVGGLHVIINCA